MLDEFIEEILKEKGLPPNMDPEVRKRLVSDMKTRVNDLINNRIIDNMNDKQLDEFNKLIDTKPDEKTVQDFIDKNVSNKQQVATAALIEFKQLYLGTA